MNDILRDCLHGIKLLIGHNTAACGGGTGSSSGGSSGSRSGSSSGSNSSGGGSGGVNLRHAPLG